MSLILMTFYLRKCTRIYIHMNLLFAFMCRTLLFIWSQLDYEFSQEILFKKRTIFSSLKAQKFLLNPFWFAIKFVGTEFLHFRISLALWSFWTLKQTLFFFIFELLIKKGTSSHYTYLTNLTRDLEPYQFDKFTEVSHIFKQLVYFPIFFQSVIKQIVFDSIIISLIRINFQKQKYWSTNIATITLRTKNGWQMWKIIIGF